MEPVSELCDAIEKVKVDFESLPRPFLRNDKSTESEKSSSKGSPQKGASPSSKLVLAVDLKSILTQKLVTRSPNKRPYIPLGGSSDNSPSKLNLIDDNMPVEVETKTIDIEKESSEKLIVEHDGKMDTTESQEISIPPSTSEDKKFLEPSTELSSEKQVVNPDIAGYDQEKTLQTPTSIDEKSSSSSTSESDKSSDTDEESSKLV